MATGTINRTLTEQQLAKLFADDGNYARLITILGTLYQLPSFIEKPLDRRHKSKQLAAVWSLEDAQIFLNLFRLRLRDTGPKLIAVIKRFKQIKHRFIWTPFLLQTAYPVYQRILSFLEECLDIKSTKIVKFIEPDYLEYLESYYTIKELCRDNDDGDFFGEK